MTTDSENWGPFHRHFASDVVYRDEDCLHDEYPRRVYVFDPDYLDEHDAAIRADEREKRDTYWQGRLENAWVQLDEAGVSLLAARAAIIDLRDKVLGLPQQGSHWVYQQAITDVLSLIDEARK